MNMLNLEVVPLQAPIIGEFSQAILCEEGSDEREELMTSTKNKVVVELQEALLKYWNWKPS